jgi:hypothetical protein
MRWKVPDGFLRVLQGDCDGERLPNQSADIACGSAPALFIEADGATVLDAVCAFDIEAATSVEYESFVDHAERTVVFDAGGIIPDAARALLHDE